MIDYHMHTSLSDGSGQHDEYLAAARERQLCEMGISDHLCLRPTRWAMLPENLSAWKKRMKSLKKLENGTCKIRTGLEVDYFPDHEEEIRKILKDLPLDYVIGSVHFLGSWNFDSSPDGYNEWELRNVYEYYYNLVRKAALSGLFDIIGHFDLVKKFGHRLISGSEELVVPVLETIRDADIAIELNTSGMNKPCREYYPTRTILEWCHQLGIPVTLGSDAHNPVDVGQYFPDAIDLLRDIGFDQLAVFENRERDFIPI